MSLPTGIVPIFTHWEYSRACAVLDTLLQEWRAKYLERSDADLTWMAQEIAELQLRVGDFAKRMNQATHNFDYATNRTSNKYDLIGATIREWQNKTA